LTRRIGILGGTFDPPHHGHLIVAGDAFEALSLDRLLFIPAGNPPHKPGSVTATGAQRLRMLEAAIAGDSRFAVDDRELRREGPSYTVDTLRELRAETPDAGLFFLLGVDQFRALGSWREPGEITRLAQLGVFARGGTDPDISGTFPAVRVPVRRIDISATEIRERIAAGRSVRNLVPDSVAAIIEEERLYRQVRKEAR
jgi:nicotinate-nucleotide adenylyltransferase